MILLHPLVCYCVENICFNIIIHKHNVIFFLYFATYVLIVRFEPIRFFMVLDDLSTSVSFVLRATAIGPGCTLDALRTGTCHRQV